MVHLLTPGINKYILAENETGELVVVSKLLDDYPEHEKIAKSEISLKKIMGGGWMLYDIERKTIRVSGKSYKYGQADHIVVQQLLQKDNRFVDYKIKIEKY
jgi:hypothetical protein